MGIHDTLRAEYLEIVSLPFGQAYEKEMGKPECGISALLSKQYQ